MKKTSKFAILITSAIIIASSALAGDCVFSLYGKCYDCNTKYALKVGSKDNCEVNCPNRIYVFKDRTCRLKVGESKAFPASKDTSVNIKNCTLKDGESKKAKKDTVETYFKGRNGKCYPCNTAEPVQVAADDCEKERFCNLNCSKRTAKNYANTNQKNGSISKNLYSVLKCPSNRPLMDRYMMCWACDEKTPIDLSFNTELHNICMKKRSMRDDQVPFSYLKD